MIITNMASTQAIIDEILFGSSQNLEMMVEKAEMDEVEDKDIVYIKTNQTTRTNASTPREISSARRKTARMKAAKNNKFRIEEKRNPFYRKPRRERRLYEMSHDFNVRKSRLNDITLAAALEEYYDDVSCMAEIEAELQEAERMRKKMKENMENEVAFCKIEIVDLEGDIEKNLRILAMEELERFPNQREFLKRKIDFARADIIKLRIRLKELEALLE